MFVCVLLAKVPLNLTAKKLNIYHTYKLTTNLLQVYHNKLTTGLLQAGGAVFLREGDTTAEVWGYWDRFPCFLRVYCQHPGAGRAVATQKREGDTTAAEGLVVATQGRHDPCVTATNTFGGKSTTTSNGKDTPFQTCYQYKDEDYNYCWSNSYGRSVETESGDYFAYFQCLPNPKPGFWDCSSDWQELDPRFVNPSTTPFSCGKPCWDMYQDF